MKVYNTNLSNFIGLTLFADNIPGLGLGLHITNQIIDRERNMETALNLVFRSPQRFHMLRINALGVMSKFSCL